MKIWNIAQKLKFSTKDSFSKCDQMCSRRYYIKVKPLEDSGLLIKGVSKTIRNKAKEQKCGFLSRLLVALGASLSGNMLAGKEANRADAGVNRAGQDF